MSNDRPDLLRLSPLDLAGIPLELQACPQFVVWRQELVEGRWTKVPYRADDPERKASSTARSTWASFAVALKVVTSELADGLGYVFADDDPFSGQDFDDCLGAGGLHPDAAAIVARLASYTEISPSGHGVKTIVRANLNGFPRNRTSKTGWGGEFEVYDHKRFFTLTGMLLPGCPPTIEPRQAELDAVLKTVFGDVASPPPPRPAQPIDLGDRELLDRAFAAKNGDRVRALWSGELSGYGSQSEADQALCNHLAFWTGRDPDRIDRLFRASGLMREKWERQDYREDTIAKAITFTVNVYEPSRRNCAGGSDAVDAVDAVGAPEAAVGGNGVTASALKDAVPPTPQQQREKLDAGTASEADAVAPSGPRVGRPFSMPVRDFISLDRPRRPPLLADADGRAVVGRHSLVVLGALGGHGKTTFSFDVFLHLAAGVDFPPFTVPAPVSVLMIENEGPEELFAEKLKLRLEHFPHELKAPLDVFTFDWGGFSLADDPLRERLVFEIGDKGYDLVFGDPLDSLGIEGVGSPQDTRAFMALMKEAGLNKTVAWWLNTHPRKEETKEALNEIAGAWGGKPDSVLLLRMLEDDRTQVRFPKLRWAKRGTRPAILLAFDPDTEAFTFLGEESEKQRDYLREIFAFVRSHPWLTKKEIAKPVKDGGVGANDVTVGRELEEHPELFESRTGDEAVALGRKANAVLWAVRPGAEENLAGLEEDE